MVICDQCYKDINDEEGTFCEGCDGRFHHDCTISKSKWESKTEAQKKKWRCHACNEKVSTVKECKLCKKPMDGDGATCCICNGAFHLDSCSIQTSSWKGMTAQRKAAWKCEFCRTGTIGRPRSGSSSRSSQKEVGNLNDGESIKATGHVTKADLSDMTAKLTAQIVEQMQILLQQQKDELKTELQEHQSQVIKRLNCTDGKVARIEQDLLSLFKENNRLEEELQKRQDTDDVDDDDVDVDVDTDDDDVDVILILT